MSLFMRNRMCMRTTASGLMVLMLMNCLTLVQKQDGVDSIALVAFLIARSQTLQVDVHSASHMVQFGLEQKRFRLALNTMMR